MGLIQQGWGGEVRVGVILTIHLRVVHTKNSPRFFSYIKLQLFLKKQRRVSLELKLFLILHIVVYSCGFTVVVLC